MNPADKKASTSKREYISRTTVLRFAFLFIAAFLPVGCFPTDSMVADPNKATIDARTALYQAAEDNDPITRAMAIEAMGQVLGQEGGAIYVQGLKDKYALVCFNSAMAIGTTQYASALPDLVKLVNDVQMHGSVQCAAIYALYRIGEDKYCSRLAQMLFDQDKTIRANAAMIMGLMGNASAIPLLKDLLRDEKEPIVLINAMEALAKLGDTGSAEKIEAFAKDRFMDDQLLAIPMLAQMRGARSVNLIKGLTDPKNPPIVRVKAFGMLSKIGESADEGYDYCIRCIRDPAAVLGKSAGQTGPTSPEALRYNAAISLGWMKRRQAVDKLLPLLAIKEGSVKVAAAMSILNILARPGHDAASRPAKAAQDAGDLKNGAILPTTMQTSGGKD